MKNHELIGKAVLVEFCAEDLNYQPGCEKAHEGTIIELGQCTVSANGGKVSGFYLEVELREALKFQEMSIVKIEGQNRYAGEGIHTLLANGWITCNLDSPGTQWYGARGEIKLEINASN